MKILRIPLVIVLVVVAGRALNAGAQTETNLYSFGNEANPQAGLVQGSDGNFYGTTAHAGKDNDGTVFRISPSGSYTDLYSFVGFPSDGYKPLAGLVQGSDGNFYGTTSGGGANGGGTVFRISPSGNETNLYSFGAYPNDGYGPSAGLVQGSDGNFYGTTSLGGTSTNCSRGCGTVFRISPSGTYTSLYSFVGSPNDGADPEAGLVQGSDGNFYGTTAYGGTNGFGYGTIFRISPSGIYTSLYFFVGGPIDGRNPFAGLVQGSDGNFYGTTSQGGTSTNGTVFKISPSSTESILYSFGRSPHDGEGPNALVQGSDGNFYGTTGYGGTNDIANGGDGTVFRISPSGSYTNLYSFVGSPNDGAQPYGRLVQGSDGNFYGTTSQGGKYDVAWGGDGTVFKLTVPLNPPPYPINQITSVHIAATNIILTIPSVAGETYQLQYRDSMSSGDWTNVDGASVTNSIGALLTLTNFGGASVPQRFYRFSITP